MKTKISTNERRVAFSVAVPLSVMAKLSELASQQNVTMSRLVADILSEHFDNRTRSGRRVTVKESDQTREVSYE